ncbi:MAG: site-specific integrase [Muribaculaceae bacterium]|nr:site-specific integrase [Muribaculaceae bacterium]
MTTVELVCYKYKPLKNGELPLKVRICKDRKSRYINLGVSTKIEDWDFLNNRLKDSHPHKEEVENLITHTISNLKEKIVELKIEQQDFTAQSLIDKVNSKTVRQTVNDVFLSHMDRLSDEGRRKYMLSIRYIYNSLIAFNKHLDIYFTEIDSTFLRKYETWLRKKKVAENTIGIHFRTLRAIYNVAINENVVKPENYPFRKYKVSRLHEETAKRSLTKTDIERVLSFKPKNNLMHFPIDIFAFTYYCGGINFIDIANLTTANIIENKIVYKRHKTGKLIKIPLQPQAVQLIKKYSKRSSPYLFPILSVFHETEVQKANRIHKVMSKVNKRLREIGEELKLPLTLTTYVARHSQATVMKKAGVSTAVIKEIMGHSSERVTQIYLDSFDNEQIDNAMKNLL